jgi:hypothetical protein
MTRARDLADFGSNATSYDAVEIDNWRLSASFTTNDAVVTGWERPENASYSKAGTGISESSGIFTFPKTGLYKVTTTAELNTGTSDSAVALKLEVSIDGGTTYDFYAYLLSGDSTSDTGRVGGATQNILVNVTNVSNFKFRLVTNSFSSGSVLEGNTDYNRTNVMFERITDSQ